MLAVPAPMEGVNIVMVHLNQWAEFVPQHNPYAIDVDRGDKNYYNCGSFGYLARNCRNRRMGGRIGEGRRLEYGNDGQRKMIEGRNEQSNLNGNRDLIVLN